METKFWITTDTHFNHAKMIEYCTRPLGYEKLITDRLQMNVKPDDVLIHLGDISMGNDKYWSNWFKDNLKCKTWLVIGNHDSHSNTWYLNNGWDFAGRRIFLKVSGKRIAFSHEPIEWDGYYDMNIHGHLHNSLREYEYTETGLSRKINDKQHLLALEFTDYHPIHLQLFLKNVQDLEFTHLL